MATQLPISWDRITPPPIGAMPASLTTFIDRLEHEQIRSCEVLMWAPPVLCFGDPIRSEVATVGINPSSLEFVDERGAELNGSSRRLPTLSSLELEDWSTATSAHLQQIIEACRSYFSGRPYTRWFNRLEQVLRGFGYSYYGFENQACHLDLVPYATTRKWGDLDSEQRSTLLSTSRDCLSLLLPDSSIRVLILNGSAVVRNFELAAGLQLDRSPAPMWALRRQLGLDVPGVAFTGFTDHLAGTPLDRRLLILGFNHNLQSSFGLSTKVLRGIESWISDRAIRQLS